MLRRLLTLVLFAASMLPSAAPMLLAGAPAAAALPMCCRRGGVHHCAGMMGEGMMAVAMSNSPTWRSPRMLCPYSQRSTGAVQQVAYLTVPQMSPKAGALQMPALAARAACLRRISFDRTRQKRGPPVLLG